MNLLDYILMALLVFCLVRGIFRGLIREISSIIGLLGGFYGAYTYYLNLAEILSAVIENRVYLNIASFVIIWLAVYVVVNMVAAVLKYFMNIVFLGWLDRIGGALFGGVKGLLATVIVIVVLTAFLPRNSAIVRDSAIARRMISVSSALVQVTTREMRVLFSSKAKELDKSWQKRKL